MILVFKLPMQLYFLFYCIYKNIKTSYKVHTGFDQNLTTYRRISEFIYLKLCVRQYTSPSTKMRCTGFTIYRILNAKLIEFPVTSIP